MIKLLDTFSGVGGFHLALQQSVGKENVECIGFSEIDKYAKQVYQERFPGSKDLGSISEIEINKLEDFDLLTGGFPCQDVSVAGKQDLSGGRTVLVEYLLQILEKKQPKYFVFENVKGLLGENFQDFFKMIMERITNAGYVYDVQVLNTKDFGLPQNRERVFIVGKLGHIFLDRITFPNKRKLKIFLKDILEDEVDEKFYMTDEQYNSLSHESIKRIYDTIAPTLDTAQGGHRQPKIVTNLNPSGKGMNGNVYRTDTEAPTLTTNKGEGIKIVDCTKQGYAEAQIGDGIVLDNPKSKTKRGRVKKGVSGTLMCNDQNGVITNDLKIRKLSPKEYERLQGFPDGWSSDIVSNSQAYKQMGNSVSIPPVKLIFDNLITGQ